MIKTIKLSRRDFTKALIGAGTFYFGLPHLSRIPSIAEATSDYPKSDHTWESPMVIIVKDDELKGFRGFEEFTVKDPDLVAGLSRGLGSLDKSRKQDPLVIFVNGDEPVGFREEEEFDISDPDLIVELSRKFRNKSGEAS